MRCFIGVGPLLLGDGLLRFPQREFKSAECKSYSNGSVLLRQQRVRSSLDETSTYLDRVTKTMGFCGMKEFPGLGIREDGFAP